MMQLILFYIAGAVAVASTILAITRANASHALMYLILSFLAVALIFFLLGAPFAAMLEVIVYAGAIMVLFMFVIMMINLTEDNIRQEKQTLGLSVWLVPAVFGVILLLELTVAVGGSDVVVTSQMVSPKEMALSMFGPYVLAVEIASMLLLAGLVGAFHIGRHYRLKDAPPTVESMEAP